MDSFIKVYYSYLIQVQSRPTVSLFSWVWRNPYETKVNKGYKFSYLFVLFYSLSNVFRWLLNLILKNSTLFPATLSTSLPGDLIFLWKQHWSKSVIDKEYWHTVEDEIHGDVDVRTVLLSKTWQRYDMQCICILCHYDNFKLSKN